MAKRKVERRMVKYDQMTYRFAPPLFELYRNYLAGYNYWQSRLNLRAERESLNTVRAEQAEILAEFEANKSIIYSEQCNVQHLHAQNRNKLSRTFSKLESDTEQLHELTANYKKVVRGMCSLVRLSKIMEAFLSRSTVYKVFVDTAAKETKQFDAFSDIINRYNSLRSILGKSTDHFNSLVGHVQTLGAQIIRESGEMEAQLSRLMHKLGRAVRGLAAETQRTASIAEKLQNLLSAGFRNETNLVRVNLFRSDLLLSLINLKAVDGSIAEEPLQVQIELINEKFNMLTSVDKIIG